MEHNAARMTRSARQYFIPKLSRLDQGDAAKLPVPYRKFWEELTREPTPVHWRKDLKKWYRDEKTGQILRNRSQPIPLLIPPEAHKGIWGGEAIIKGFQKRQELKARVPHYWVPTLLESIVYSEVLNKHLSTVVTRRALLLITSNFGLDHYLLRTPACDLASKLALGLKRKILLALRDQSLYPDDPVKRKEVYGKYKHYLDAYTHEEIEWYGLFLGDALNKLKSTEDAAKAPKPLKILYRQELIEELRNPPVVQLEGEEPIRETTSWIQKLNPFSKKVSRAQADKVEMIFLYGSNRIGAATARRFNEL